MPELKSTQSKERRGFLGAGFAALAAFFTRTAEGGTEQAPSTPGHIQIGRRIVTGTDSQGRSRIDSEAPLPRSATWNNSGAQGMDFWVVRQVPAPLNGPLEPPADWHVANRATPGGIVGRLITWAPGFEYSKHTTPTLDFGIIVSGQLELILETGSRILKPGDVVIQRGTAHAWRVVGEEPCTWVVVLIDAETRA